MKKYIFVLLVIATLVILSPFIENLDSNKLFNCKTITKDQALLKVKNLPEVKNYYSAFKGKSTSPIIEVKSKDENLWEVVIYEFVKDNDEIGHFTTFNWYSIDKCTGNLKCSFSVYDKRGKLIKVSSESEYPCNH